MFLLLSHSCLVWHTAIISFWNRIPKPSQRNCANLGAAFVTWQDFNRQKLLGDVLSIPGLLCNLWLFAWWKEWDVAKGDPFRATCCVFKALREGRSVFYSRFSSLWVLIGKDMWKVTAFTPHSGSLWRVNADLLVLFFFFNYKSMNETHNLNWNHFNLGCEWL